MDPQVSALAPTAGYLSGLARAPLSDFVSNAGGARFLHTGVDGKTILVVTNDGDADDCYLVSAYAHYVRYMREEVAKLAPGVARLAVRAALEVLGAVARATRFNRTVSINNWLYSTNPSSDLRPAELAALTESLVRRYPSHALVFRSLDAGDGEQLARLRSAGYRLVINRPVHIWHPEFRMTRRQREEHARDRTLLRRSRIEIADEQRLVAPGDFARMSELYRMLYIGKHSRLNPSLTPEYFALAIRTGALRAKLLHHDGCLVAFASYFVDGRRGMVVPTAVGYDTAPHRRALGLYRCLMSVLYTLAKESGLGLFLSSGAARFKLHRGSIERLEYEAVYDRHLSLARRLPWRATALLFRAAAASLDSSQI